jgi:hypothetical protein
LPDHALLQDEVLTATCEQLLAGCWCVTDPSKPGNPFVAISNQFEAVTGYAAAEVLGRGCKLLHGPKADLEVSSHSDLFVAHALLHVQLTCKMAGLSVCGR